MSLYNQVRQKGVKKFVSATKRDQYWQLLEQERASLLDSSTGKVKASLVEKVNCVVCQKNNSQVVFIKQGFTFVKCKTCSTIYINPQLKEEVLNNYYQESKTGDFWIDILLTQAQLDYDIKKYRQVLTKITDDYNLKQGKVLDVGCSVGTFLNEAKKSGFEVYGVEPNQKARQLACRLYNLNVTNRFLTESSFLPKSFDLITFWEVLEHTKKPRELLKLCYKLLKSGGLVFFLVGGNSHSLANRAMQASSAAFDFGRQWYFNPGSITRLLDECGFKTMEIKSIIPEIDVLINYLNYQQPYQSETKNKLFSLSFLDDLKKEIEKQNMGYKLLVFAQKQ